MVEEKDGADWLFPKTEQQKAAQEEKALVFAQRYLVFFGPTSDPRARELLEHWSHGVRKQLVPPNASAQESAYWNSRREFVEAIWSQIGIAQNGKNQPAPQVK